MKSIEKQISSFAIAPFCEVTVGHSFSLQLSYKLDLNYRYLLPAIPFTQYQSVDVSVRPFHFSCTSKKTSTYLFQYLVFRYQWLVLKDQRGHCSTLKIRHPFPKSSLSLELEQRGENQSIQCSLSFTTSRPLVLCNVDSLPERMVISNLSPYMVSLMFLPVFGQIFYLRPLRRLRKK